MANYYLERLNDNNADNWEELNNISNEGSFFHSLKWKHIFENTSKIRTHYFLLFKNNSIFGIFPFIEHKILSFAGLIPLHGFGHHNIIIRDINDSSAIQFVINEFQKTSINQKKFHLFVFQHCIKK